MNAVDIVGYTYRSENLHPHCLRLATGPGERYDGWALADGVVMATEDDLNEVAYAYGINRRDEATFDSDDFPKVIFADMVAEGEECSRCGIDLLEPPGNPWEHATERS
jgi:hypothetical protein